MATRRQRERKARQRRWESLRSRNRARGRWTVGERVTGSRVNLSLRDEFPPWVDEKKILWGPIYISKVAGDFRSPAP